MNEFEMTPQSAFSPAAAATAERVTAFLRKVYGWMFVGLGVTAAVALGVASSPSLVQAVARNSILFFALAIGQLGLVFYLSARVSKLAPSTASILFLVYAALNGVIFSFIFLMYTGTSIATTFLVTAGMFGALALYGSTTRRSLAGVGQFVFMGLIGLILASLVGVFVKSEGDWARAEAAARNVNPMPKDAVLKARLRGEILTLPGWNYDDPSGSLERDPSVPPRPPSGT